MKTLSVKNIFILFTVIFITGCKKNIVINEKQAILFQVEYINYAWGYQHNGFIIDNEGNVLTYKNPQNWNFPDKDFNLTRIRYMIILRNVINSGKKIPPEELRKYARLYKKHIFKQSYCT